MDAPPAGMVKDWSRVLRGRGAMEKRMTVRIAASITRGAATALSRRASVLALGGGAFAAVTAPAIAAAGTSGRQAAKRCTRQRAQCLASIAAFCQPQGNPNECEAALNPCCGPYARCNASRAITCLFDELLGVAGG